MILKLILCSLFVATLDYSLLSFSVISLHVHLFFIETTITPTPWKRTLIYLAHIELHAQLFLLSYINRLCNADGYPTNRFFYIFQLGFSNKLIETRRKAFQDIWHIPQYSCLKHKQLIVMQNQDVALPWQFVVKETDI
mgnify:FL=1